MRGAQYRTEGFTANQPTWAQQTYSPATFTRQAKPNRIQKPTFKPQPFTSAFQFHKTQASMIQENACKVPLFKRWEQNAQF